MNNSSDVNKVQALLNSIPAVKGGPAPPLVVSGTCDILTRAAILRFQTLQAPAFADGRIDPGGPTLARLNALAAAPGPSPTPSGVITGSLADVTRARHLATSWLSAVEPSISGFVFSVKHGLSYSQAPSLKFIEDAFHKHFKLVLSLSKKDGGHPNTKVFDPVTDTTFLPTIRANFKNIAGVVASPSKFDLITEAKSRADNRGNLIAAYVLATGGNVNISPAFNSPTRGPNCQAAIVIHESTHVVDGLSGDPAAHISEWASADPPVSGRFAAGAVAAFGSATAYDLQTPEKAIHNASAYASFAAHVARGKDERFGDARQTE